jgi:hypothetical protein
MKLSAILLLVLLGIIVWSTMRMSRRREDARRAKRSDRGDRGDRGDDDGGSGGDGSGD